jgi:methyl-accepting chemotaxis protein
MSKIISKITVPIILVGTFSVIVFVALNYENLGPSFYIVFLPLVIYIFSFGFAVGQNFVSPIKKLLEKATEISKGNLSSRVYLQTKDELSQLADILNQIAEELEESHIDGEMIEKTTDVKVKARTRVLEETVSALEEKIKNRTVELEKMMRESKTLQNQAKEKEAEILQLKKVADDLSLKFKRIQLKKLKSKNKRIK